MMSVQERYQRDPVFKNLVDALSNALEQLHYTPTEMRECAMLACVLYEQRHSLKKDLDAPLTTTRCEITMRDDH